jgi:hypothetical protein
VTEIISSGGVAAKEGVAAKAKPRIDVAKVSPEKTALIFVIMKLLHPAAVEYVTGKLNKAPPWATQGTRWAGEALIRRKKTNEED